MIPFTQYLRPDGRKQSVEVERPDDIERLAQEFIAAGGYFECEELTTGQVSLTAGHPSCEAGDMAIVICENGPSVPGAVDKLVANAIEWLRREYVR